MIYLDNAATSRFKPNEVLCSMINEIQQSSNPGRSGHKDAFATAIKLYEARSYIAQTLRLKGNVIFTSGCTEALNLAILGSNIRGHVITSLNEHNSVLRPLYHLEKQGLVKITLLSPHVDGSVSAESIDNAVRRDTKMIIVNHISNVTGAEADLYRIGEVAKKRNLLFLVDAAQSLGHRKIDMQQMNIHLLAAAGHKGLHGPQGVGFLAVSENVQLNPIRFGGTGTDSYSLDQPKTFPEGYESGTVNTPAILGMKAGMQWTFDHFNEVHSRIQSLSEKLLEGLRAMKDVSVYSKLPNGVISFNLKGISGVGDILSEHYDIALRGGLHCAPLVHSYLGTLKTGALRAGIGYNNTDKDIDDLLSALKEIQKTKTL